MSTKALPSSSEPSDDDVPLAGQVHEIGVSLRREIAKRVVAQDAVVEQLLIAMLARGHCLVQGVPGLAKTLLVSTLADATDLQFRRIQFTPDLMPSDITGSDILQEDPESGRRRFEFQPGPVFTHLLLADEVNRAPPKSQAALLQAMQEREVTVGGRTLPLPDPFLVLATQNPIEQEGTYPLPEAQLDRFMFMVLVGYPSRDEELEVLKLASSESAESVQRVVGADALVRLQQVVRRVPVGEHLCRFVLDLIRATRPQERDASDFVRQWLSWGAGPRAGQFLLLASKARALLHGRPFVSMDDVDALAPAVLRHRLVPNFAAEAEGVTVDQIIDKLLMIVPRGDEDQLL